MTALMPFRAGGAAFLSSSSSNKDMAPGLVSGNPGTPPPMKLARREVPLPSQEGKKGVVQYALYVEFVSASQQIEGWGAGSQKWVSS
jgi:NADH dehydrogenase (ubiquinone) Fe-S protein 7